MKLAFVVQRYGEQVPGGAESFCRGFAERLAGRGHDVSVATSNAVSYVDWAPALPAGVEMLNGVAVHRLAVVRPRPDDLFGPLNARMHSDDAPPATFLQQEWMHMQGPLLDGLRDWIAETTAAVDAMSFFTYLYHPTYTGLPVAAGRTATVLHPTAHDEPPLYVPLYAPLFRLAGSFGFLTEEEAALVRRVFHVHQPSVTTGVGIDVDHPADGASFRARFDLDDDPVLLYTGRIDPHKGAVELVEFFKTYKKRHAADRTKLVLVGDPVRPIDPGDDVVVTGFVDEQTKHDAYDAADVFVQPSFFESFSIVLCEAWAHGKPALVQGRSDVLTGQTRRSGGGVPYHGYAEFEAALELLLHDARLRATLGARGRAYVVENYRWDHVIDLYEQFLIERVERRTRRTLLG